MKKHVIIAPHADDEIIGCNAILVSGEVFIVAFPNTNKLAEIEVQTTQDKFEFHVQSFSCFRDITELAQIAKEKGGLLFLPDPNYELHPDHRMIGAWGERLVKQRGFSNIVFYTTNMNAPYMQEVENIGEKKVTLTDCYPDKESLWQYDHKYFLFEGYCRYGNPLKV